MKKRTLLSLSIVSTMSLLTLTSCGNNNDTSVSAMNETPMPTETSTIAEETSSIEMSEFNNLRAQVGEMEEIGASDEAKTTVTVDSTSADIPFTEGEERGEDLSTVEESTEPAETINTPSNGKAPFTVDDFDYSGYSDLFETEEEKKDYLQMCIDDYESGELDYDSLLGALADVGIDNTKYAEEYDKSLGIGTTGTTTNTQQSQQQPDNIQGHWVVPGVTPEETIPLDDNYLHPELKDVHAY